MPRRRAATPTFFLLNADALPSGAPSAKKRAQAQASCEENRQSISSNGNPVEEKEINRQSVASNGKPERQNRNGTGAGWQSVTLSGNPAISHKDPKHDIRAFSVSTSQFFRKIKKKKLAEIQKS